MKPRKHAIFTAVNARYGDFLIQHWLASLQANVNLSDIDVLVLDYGLTDAHREQLTAKGVLHFRARADGNIGNIRWRDLASVLDRTSYDQVLLCDGGDILFQADISHLFESDKNALRGAYEENAIESQFHWMARDDFKPEVFESIASFLRGRLVVNAGLLLGPAQAMKGMWASFQPFVRSFGVLGTDQFLINYLLHKDGFVALESKYNYVIVMSKFQFEVRRGVFLNKQGDIIPVIHNAGSKDEYRAIVNFGFGPNRNRVKWLLPTFKRFWFWWDKRCPSR